MQLACHPAGQPGPVASFSAEAADDVHGALCLRWTLTGNLAALRLPEPGPALRVDGLWRHTCFEAFIAAAGRPGYAELNFSPSGAWAAYRFAGYRTGMQPVELPLAPTATWSRRPGQLQLQVVLQPAVLDPLAGAGPWRVAMPAVIEEQSGTISYWAWRHPAAQPDFHHSGGFVLEVPGHQAGHTRER